MACFFPGFTFWSPLIFQSLCRACWLVETKQPSIGGALLSAPPSNPMLQAVPCPAAAPEAAFSIFYSLPLLAHMAGSSSFTKPVSAPLLGDFLLPGPRSSALVSLSRSGVGMERCSQGVWLLRLLCSHSNRAQACYSGLSIHLSLQALPRPLWQDTTGERGVISCVFVA